LPESVANRQDKIGFYTPQDIWLGRHPGDEVAEIINSSRFRQRPFFDARAVEREFKSHQQGRGNIGSAIWRWINLELWLRKFIDR